MISKAAFGSIIDKIVSESSTESNDEYLLGRDLIIENLYQGKGGKQIVKEYGQLEMGAVENIPQYIYSAMEFVAVMSGTYEAIKHVYDAFTIPEKQIDEQLFKEDWKHRLILEGIEADKADRICSSFVKDIVKCMES